MDAKDIDEPREHLTPEQARETTRTGLFLVALSVFVLLVFAAAATKRVYDRVERKRMLDAMGAEQPGKTRSR